MNSSASDLDDTSRFCKVAVGVRVVGSERHGHRLKTATLGRKDGPGQADLVMRTGSG